VARLGGVAAISRGSGCMARQIPVHRDSSSPPSPYKTPLCIIAGFSMLENYRVGLYNYCNLSNFLVITTGNLPSIVLYCKLPRYLGGAESTGQPILETQGDSIGKMILCFD
jgi:hypothetical protein